MKMINGKEKAMILLSILNSNQANNILKNISEADSAYLGQNIDNTPEYDTEMLNAVLQEALAKTEGEDTTRVNSPNPSAAAVPVNSVNKQPQKAASKPVTKSEAPDAKSNIQKIVTKIEEQKPQLIAFLLEKLDNETLKNDILTRLTPETKEKIKNIDVEHLPISDKVYQKIHQKIFS